MFFLFFLTILLPTILSQENIAYDYLNHGSDWTGTCKDGTRQSPIDLISNIAKNSTKFSYFQPLYAPSFAFVSHLNTSLLLEGSFGSLFTISADLIAKSLNLNADQVRFRAPSEHTFGGARYPLEVQIHHQGIYRPTVQGYVSLFFNVTSESSPFLRSIINAPDSSALMLDLSQVLPTEIDDETEFYGYSGSHTFPECKENVNWYIINKIFGASQEELDWFTSLYNGNPKFAGNGNYRETKKYTKNALFYFKKN